MGQYLIESEVRPPTHKRLIAQDVEYTVMILPFPKRKAEEPNYLVAYMCGGRAHNKVFFVYLEAHTLEEATEIVEKSGDITFETMYDKYVSRQLGWREKGSFDEW